MTRRVRRLPVLPGPHPTQLVLGLDGIALVDLGKRSRARGKWIPGGNFPMAAKAQERAA